MVVQRYDAASAFDQEPVDRPVAERPFIIERAVSGQGTPVVSPNGHAGRGSGVAPAELGSGEIDSPAMIDPQRSDAEAIRWRRVTAVAAASVLVWTVMLGVMLAPSGPQVTSNATTAGNQQTVALPATSVEGKKDSQREADPATAAVRGPDSQLSRLPAASIESVNDSRPSAAAQKPTMVATSPGPDSLSATVARQLIVPMEPVVAAILGSGEANGAPGKMAAVRPRSYSSVDAQTLAAARIRGEELSGKRAPVADSTPTVVDREIGVTASSEAVADERPLRAGGANDPAQSSNPRAEVSATAAPAAGPRSALPRPESPKGDPGPGLLQSPNAPAATRLGLGSSTVAAQPPASRIDVAQVPTSAREAKRVPPVSRSEISPQRPDSGSDQLRAMRPATVPSVTSSRADPFGVVRPGAAPAPVANAISPRTDSPRLGRPAPSAVADSTGARSDAARGVRSTPPPVANGPSVLFDAPRSARLAPVPAAPYARAEPSGVPPSKVATVPAVPNARAEPPRITPSKVATAVPSGRSEPPRSSPSTVASAAAGPFPRSESPRAERLAPSNAPIVGPRYDSPRVARLSPANGTESPTPRDAPAIVDVAPRTIPANPQPDAAAARMEDGWERRERWLRERLQTR